MTVYNQTTVSDRILNGEAQQILKQAHSEYAHADPFPHVVIERFLQPDLYKKIVAAFPGPEQELWERYRYKYQTKLACNDLVKLPDPITELLYYLNSASFLQMLETLTGEKGLIGDPYFIGGGIHQIQSGGRLSIHADFTEPSHLKLYRRLNLLIYLNDDWDPAYGGNLELWDRAMSRCVRIISPDANRCVIFTTTPTSFHGHPEPLTCPDGITRKSIAVYYYVLEKPVETAGVLTRWQQKKEGPVLRRALAGLFWRISYKLAALAGLIDV